jgi:hypothetical protein
MKGFATVVFVLGLLSLLVGSLEMFGSSGLQSLQGSAIVGSCLLTMVLCGILMVLCDIKSKLYENKPAVDKNSTPS